LVGIGAGGFEVEEDEVEVEVHGNFFGEITCFYMVSIKIERW
jgi:hypothetical protein